MLRKNLCLAALAGLTVFLTACESTPRYQWQWQRENTSRDDTVNKINQCKYDVAMVREMTPEKENDLFNACMKKDGYRYVQVRIK